MSPNLVKRVPHDPFASDVWAIGVIVYLMAERRWPFDTDVEEEKLVDEMQYTPSFEMDGEVPVNLCGFGTLFLTETLMFEEERRPDIKELQDHFWFDGEEVE